MSLFELHKTQKLFRMAFQRRNALWFFVCNDMHVIMNWWTFSHLETWTMFRFVPANYCRIFIHSLCWLPKLTALGHVLVLVKIILQPGRLIFITDGLVIFKCRLCSFNVAHKVAVGIVIVATATWNGKKWALIGPFHRIFLFSGGSHHWNLNQFSFDVQCLHMTSFTCELISDIIYKIS